MLKVNKQLNFISKNHFDVKIRHFDFFLVTWCVPWIVILLTMCYITFILWNTKLQITLISCYF